MRRPWFFVLPFVFAILVIGAITSAWIWGDGGDRDWGPGNHTEVTRIVNPDGSDTGSTILIESNRGGHFFPFGLLIFPLFIFGFFALMRGLFWRRGPGGPGGPGGYRSWNQGTPSGPPPWFDEWHRNAHAHDSPPSPNANPASPDNTAARPGNQNE